jgi:hypothetical protein
MKLCTAHGASARSSVSGMSPAVLFSVTFTVSVDGTFLPSGRFTFFGALPVVSAL